MVKDFVMIESDYGKFIINRHCLFQAEALIKTGLTHIEDELQKIFVFMDHLDDGSVIIDGGANIGFFTIPVADRVQGRNMRILSFEPQRPIFSALSGSVVLNGLTNVSVANKALGDRSSWVRMPDIDYGKEQDFGSCQIGSEKASGNPWLDPRLCEIVSIDSMKLDRLDFLKLDVEGHEISALQGGKQTISRYRPWIWIEYFIIGEESIKNQLKYLDQYEFYIMDSQNMLCAPKERLQSTKITVIGITQES